MADITFFSVLKSNLECALCEKSKCPVKYYPNREKIQFYNGTKYVIRCEKDHEAYDDETILNRP